MPLYMSVLSQLNATPETGSLVGEVDQLDYLKQVRQTAEEIAMSKDKKVSIFRILGLIKSVPLYPFCQTTALVN